MEILKELLNGAALLQLPASQDERGCFVKTFHQPSFQQLHLPFTLQESYYSISSKNVIRGMHFQTPPAQHTKIVFCTKGAIVDVIIDLRKKSPSYGQVYADQLSAENNYAFYIPEGFAHGFLSLSDESTTHYLVSSAYSPEHDRGIRYNSIPFDWGLMNPIISNRDMQFLALSDFVSPF